MKKSKFIDYAVLMAVRSNRNKNQKRRVDNLISHALSGKTIFEVQQKEKLIKAITIAVLSEGLGA